MVRQYLFQATRITINCDRVLVRIRYNIIVTVTVRLRVKSIFVEHCPMTF